MGPPLVTRQVSNLLVVHFIGRLSLETKPRPKSRPTLSIVWRRLKTFAFFHSKISLHRPLTKEIRLY